MELCYSVLELQTYSGFIHTKEARDFDIRIPILEDRAQVVSADLNFHQAGEVVVLNTENWSIIYRGEGEDPLKSYLHIEEGLMDI